MYEDVIAGIIGGIAYSTLGWAKASRQKSEGLDWKKLGKTVIISAVVGGIAGYRNADFSVLMSGGAGIFVTTIVNKFVSIIWKSEKLKKKGKK